MCGDYGQGTDRHSCLMAHKGHKPREPDQIPKQALDIVVIADIAVSINRFS